VARSALRYQSRVARKDAAAIERMRELSAQYPRYGYRRIRIFLGRDGHRMSVGRARLAEIGHRAGLGSRLPEQLRQPRDVDGDAARFVLGVSICRCRGSTDAVSVVVVREDHSALRIWTDHGPGTLATYELLRFKMAVPFISQIAKLPDVSCHRMSDLPSPL
jgi:hypothetical protein